MVLGYVGNQVGDTRSPIVVESILIFAAADPKETHAHRIGASGQDGIVCDTGCHQIIGLERSSRLRPTHFNEAFAQWYHLAAMKSPASSASADEDMTDLMI